MADLQNRGADPPLPEDLRSAWQQLVAPIQREAAKKPSPPTPEGADAGGRIEIIRELFTQDGVRHFEAWDRTLRLPVGVRELLADGRPAASAEADFWHRVRFQARQRHTNLLAVYAVDAERRWVVTELCRRSMLDQLPEGALPGDRARQALTAALSGLDHLHRQGCVHGQIHPGALLRDEQETVKLDLGSGRDAGAELALRPGLEKYAAPETLDEQRFGRAGAAVDLYALGMVMVELLAGDRFVELFVRKGLDVQAGPDDWSRWHMSASARLPRIAELLPEVPAAVGAVIDRMLEKRVEDRLPSAAAGLDMLAAGGGLVPVRPAASPPVERATPAALSIRAVEPPPLVAAIDSRSAAAAPALVSYHGGPRLQRLVERVSDKKNANAYAGALLLLAAFVAGVSLLAVPEKGPKPAAVALSTPPPAPLAAPVVVAEVPAAAAASPPPPPAPPSDEVVPSSREPGPVEPPPEAPLPQPSQLVLTVEPDGAWVELDGERLTGRSPWQLNIPPGPHVVRAGKWDRFEKSQHIDAPASGGVQHVAVRLLARPIAPLYEPMLVGASPFSVEADRLLAQLLSVPWESGNRGGELTRLEVAARTRHKQVLDADPRVAHALALAAFGRGRHGHAVQLYAKAAQRTPVEYSWTRKGLIRCLLAEQRFVDALYQLETFSAQAQSASVESTDAALAHALVLDTTRFAGQTLAVMRAGRAVHAADLELLSRRLTSAMNQASRESFDNAHDETLARMIERGVGAADDWRALAVHSLGDSIARERIALVESLRAEKPALRAGQSASWRVVLPVSAGSAAPLAAPTALTMLRDQ